MMSLALLRLVVAMSRRSETVSRFSLVLLDFRVLRFLPVHVMAINVKKTFRKVESMKVENGKWKMKIKN